jgi:hypothetical protein
MVAGLQIIFPVVIIDYFLESSSNLQCRVVVCIGRDERSVNAKFTSVCTFGKFV